MKGLSVSTIEDMKHSGMILESLSISLFVNINTMSVDACIGGESNPGLPRGMREFYH